MFSTFNKPADEVLEFQRKGRWPEKETIQHSDQRIFMSEYQIDKDFQDKLLDDPRLLALTKIKVKSKAKKAVNTERQELEQIVKFLLSKPKSSFWVEKVTDRLI